MTILPSGYSFLLSSSSFSSSPLFELIVLTIYIILHIFHDPFAGAQQAVYKLIREKVISFSTSQNGPNGFSKLKGRELAVPNVKGIVVNVKTYYIARNIDVMKVHSSLYDTKYQQFDKKSVTIEIDKDLNQYISIFSYGSCVFFNIPKGKFSSLFTSLKIILSISLLVLIIYINVIISITYSSRRLLRLLS